MIWPPQDTGLFEFKMPCCTCTECSLLVPPDQPFPTEGDAVAALLTDVSHCIGWIERNHLPEIESTFSAGFSSGVLELTGALTWPYSPPPEVGPHQELFFGMWGIIKLSAPGVISVDYSFNGTVSGEDWTDSNFGFATIYDSDGTIVQSFDTGTSFVGSAVGTWVSDLLPAGCYALRVQLSVEGDGTMPAPPGSTITLTGNASAVWSASAPIIPGRIVAQWDDGSGVQEIPCE